MKVKLPEPVSPEVLYERSMKYNDLHQEELRDLLSGLETALNLVCARKLSSREFSIIDYEIMFYRGDYENGDFIGKGFMAGGFNLESQRVRNFVIPEFRRNYKKLFEKVREDFSRRPGSLNLDVLIVGYRDCITHEVEVFNPLDN
jgi:hypothetical protein